ncbi:MAG: phytoene/squalene synthase family protein [Thermoguttaceae bacterium]|nr:phytoene/squalene synthase family protein [Thermoguttaceae bacterium]
MISLNQSQQYCRRVVKNSKSSFGRAIAILPPVSQSAMESLYAFMRTIDDIADSETLPPQEKKNRLEEIRQQVLTPQEDFTPSYNNVELFNFVPAFLDAVERFAIPQSCITDVIEGMLFDSDFRPLNDVDELKWYCHCVAGTVGLACVKIWGLKQGDISVERAWGRIEGWIEQQAFAVQLTNILRDIKEDALRGRVYIPVDVLRRYAWNPALFMEQVQNNNFKQGEATDMIMDLVAMAEGNYLSSKLLDEYLSPRGQKSNRLIRRVYEAILQKVRNCPDLVLARGVHLTRWEKVKLAFTELLWKK